MLWFKKKNSENKELEDDILYSESADENITEDEILEALNSEAEDSEPEEETMFSSEINDSLGEEEQKTVEDDPELVCFDETDTAQTESDDVVKVTKIIGSFDELAEYVCKKPIGCIQYMRKENKEVFQLREAHLRIAASWESISMAKDYSERDYAKIVLANDVLFNPKSFYVLPMLTEAETQDAIKTFCFENYGENGKKYAKNPEKFSKLINTNGDFEKWLEFTKGITSVKLEEFCHKHEIHFDDFEPVGEVKDE